MMVPLDISCRVEVGARNHPDSWYLSNLLDADHAGRSRLLHLFAQNVVAERLASLHYRRGVRQMACQYVSD